MITTDQRYSSAPVERGLAKYEAKVREGALLGAAAAMARVIYREVKVNTSGQRKGSGPPGKVTGNLDAAVYRVYAQDRSTPERKVYRVGVNKSKAPHWFIIEYGTSKRRAFPYLRPTMAFMPDAVRAGLNVISNVMRA